VPGESYLAALDAFHDSDIAVTVCRQEGGAAMMAEAVGKATGRPGVCFVTRGPGATNQSNHALTKDHSFSTSTKRHVVLHNWDSAGTRFQFPSQSIHSSPKILSPN
jgi:hypothetical protein